MVAQKLLERDGKDMTKISITIIIKDDSIIQIANSNETLLNVKLDEGVIKASEIFQLFDNGIDVSYECQQKPLVAEEGHNLTRCQLIYNDCLELIHDIISSINQKILDFNKPQEGVNEETSEEKQ